MTDEKAIEAAWPKPGCHAGPGVGVVPTGSVRGCTTRDSFRPFRL